MNAEGATVPVAYVIRHNVDRRGVKSVTVRCCHCGRLHFHGVPDGVLGVRLSHCLDRTGGEAYELVDPAA